MPCQSQFLLRELAQSGVNRGNCRGLNIQTFPQCLFFAPSKEKTIGEIFGTVQCYFFSRGEKLVCNAVHIHTCAFLQVNSNGIFRQSHCHEIAAVRKGQISAVACRFSVWKSSRILTVQTFAKSVLVGKTQQLQCKFVLQSFPSVLLRTFEVGQTANVHSRELFIAILLRKGVFHRRYYIFSRRKSQTARKQTQSKQLNKSLK